MHQGKQQHMDPTRMNGNIYDFEDAVEKLLVREVKEEAGVDIKGDDFRYINSVAFIRPDETPVVLIKLAARYKSGTVVLEDSFSDYAWVDAEEVKGYDCIKGIAEEIRKTIKIFSN